MLIAGVDEVGRGAWAGPIVASAVILNVAVYGLRDSKMLTPAQRTRLDQEIRDKAQAFSIALLAAEAVDELGINEANRLVLRMAIDALTMKPDLVRVDGFSSKTEIPEEVYIRGDQTVPEISAASIVAKVYRDKLMRTLHQNNPHYGFIRHVGYGTREHARALQEYGPSPQHRMSFAPLKQLMKQS